MIDARTKTLGEIGRLRDFMEKLEADVRSVGAPGQVALSGRIGSTFRGKECETCFHIDATMLTHCVDALECQLLGRLAQDAMKDKDEEGDYVPTWFLLRELAIRAGEFFISPNGLLTLFYGVCFVVLWALLK